MIHIVGNCQRNLLAASLEMMSPGISIRCYGGVDAVQAAPDDVVLWQHRGLKPVELPSTDARVYAFPTVYFNAFHPDLVRARWPDDRVRSPLHFCNSSLVLYGWSRGLRPAETVRLFCEPVFERLGFFGLWDRAKRALLGVARASELPLDAEFARWARAGCFMHLDFHPKLAAFADVARLAARRAGLEIPFPDAWTYLADPMLDGPIWPVYPEVAQRLGFEGNYAFKPARSADAIPAPMDLERFIAASYARYEGRSPGDLQCKRLEDPAFREVEELARRGGAAPARNGARRGAGVSPYASLPDERFWRRAVESVAPREVDPMAAQTLPVRRGARVATAGSCFAQHLSKTLASGGYNFYRTEDGGPFSALYGNVYTARQLVQLFDRAFGTFEPRDVAWLRGDGRYIDPFRPHVAPAGFGNVTELVDARDRHLARVRELFERLDVFVFTLGLTEAWYAEDDGAHFPLAPGVVADGRPGAAYAFRNFGARDVADDLAGFVRRLGAVNPRARMVVSVSPVPLVATYEPRHVLISSTAGKAILRAAADEFVRAHPAVAYFPAYEIIAAPFHRGAYIQDDLRSVSPAGVDHVMRVFFAHCEDAAEAPAPDDSAGLEEMLREMLLDCDEERLDAREPIAHAAAD
jgi:hypothetical protein